MHDVLLSAFSTILLALLGVATRYVVKWLNSKGIVAKLEANKTVVSVVVNAVEQIYKNIDSKGEEKLKLAEEKIVKILADKGIKITDEELNSLIESAVKTMNDTVKKELSK